MKLKKNQSFTIVSKTKIINQVKKDQNENPLKSEDNGQHEIQGDEREKRGKKKCRRRKTMPPSTICTVLKGRGNNDISNNM